MLVDNWRMASSRAMLYYYNRLEEEEKDPGGEGEGTWKRTGIDLMKYTSMLQLTLLGGQSQEYQNY